MPHRTTRRELLKQGLCLGAATMLPKGWEKLMPTTAPSLSGNRFLTFNAVVRVNQIEVSRDRNAGFDEGALHTPERVRAMRDALKAGCPNAKMTWAFSWLALKDPRPNYVEIRRLVASFVRELGDELTFIPGGYFAPMYNPREQINRDLHDALRRVGEIVGGGYRPKSVVAGFLAADNLRFLAESEGIHVCQGNIWSQFGIDNGDGDGAPCYPYYPSKQHFLKPAQGKVDFIDCVNLDGWTCDFLAARRPGFQGGFNSRLGVGPIETYRNLGEETGLKQAMATTAVHFDQGFKLNGFAWVTNIWEVSLAQEIRIENLTRWVQAIMRRWPETKVVTLGEFGTLWRAAHRGKNDWSYRFEQTGTGIQGSDAGKTIRWFMCPQFRLALLDGLAIDFTRYDLPAQEPPDATPDKPSRNWSLMNRLNQKGTRPQDKPIRLRNLPTDELKLILKHFPELAKEAG